MYQGLYSLSVTVQFQYINLFNNTRPQNSLGFGVLSKEKIREFNFQVTQ